MSGDRLDLLARIQELEQENKTLKQRDKPVIPITKVASRPIYNVCGVVIDDDIYYELHCPICNELVGIDDNCYNYCKNCGQALDWSDEE